jgi:Abnormal spindle-like microcephaly-assoc'd, ASPM-SPD-2-Hydin
MTTRTAQTNRKDLKFNNNQRKSRFDRSLAALCSILLAILAAASLSSCAGYTKAAASNGSTQAAAAVLTANVASVTFGTVPVGGTATQAVTITNTGTETVTVSETVSGNGFTAAAGNSTFSVAAGQSAAVRLQITTLQAGPFSGSFSFSWSHNQSPLTLPVSGTATPAQGAQISATPASAVFGNVATGIANSQAILLQNAGNATLTFSQVSVTGAGFSVTGLSTSSTVPAGGSTSFDVMFDPSSAGAATGSVVLATNGTPAQLTIAVSGTGVAATHALNVSASSLAFGTVQMGSNESQNIVVTNTGSSSVTISGVTVSGAGFTASGILSGTTLTPSQTATLNVVFSPASVGSATGSLTIASNASNSSIAIALTGAAHSVSLTWSASTSTGVTGYNVYRGTTSGQYSKITSSPIAASQLNYTDMAVQSGTYYYVVTAVESGAESTYSNAATATIP